MFKKSFYIILLYIIKINYIFANSGTIKAGLINGQTNEIINFNKSDETIIGELLNYIQNSITDLVAIIAVGVFIYIGINLVIARGNPEEFKKHITHFVYAAIGFFIIAAAWAIVKLVASLNI